MDSRNCNRYSLEPAVCIMCARSNCPLVGLGTAPGQKLLCDLCKNRHGIHGPQCSDGDGKLIKPHSDYELRGSGGSPLRTEYDLFPDEASTDVCQAPCSPTSPVNGIPSTGAAASAPTTNGTSATPDTEKTPEQTPDAENTPDAEQAPGTKQIFTKYLDSLTPKQLRPEVDERQARSCFSPERSEFPDQAEQSDADACVDNYAFQKDLDSPFAPLPQRGNGRGNRQRGNTIRYRGGFSRARARSQPYQVRPPSGLSFIPKAVGHLVDSPSANGHDNFAAGKGKANGVRNGHTHEEKSDTNGNTSARDGDVPPYQSDEVDDNSEMPFHDYFDTALHFAERDDVNQDLSDTVIALEKRTLEAEKRAAIAEKHAKVMEESIKDTMDAFQTIDADKLIDIMSEAEERSGRRGLNFIWKNFEVGTYDEAQALLDREREKYAWKSRQLRGWNKTFGDDVDAAKEQKLTTEWMGRANEERVAKMREEADKAWTRRMDELQEIMYPGGKAEPMLSDEERVDFYRKCTSTEASVRLNGVFSQAKAALAILKHTHELHK